MALGIVGSPDDNTTQFLFQDPGILPLEALRCGITHIGIALMPVQTPEECFLAVQIEAVGLELRRTEANLCLPGIQHHAVFAQQCHPAGIPVGIFNRPGSCPVVYQTHRACGSRAGLGQNGFFFRIDQLDPVGAVSPIFRSDPELKLGQIGGSHIDIRNVAGFLHIQPDLPVKAAIGQIINNKTEGRNGAVFRGIQLHRQQVISAIVHRLGNIHPKACIAGAVGGQFPTVHIDRGDMGRTVKLQKKLLSPEQIADFQLPAIAA